MPLACWVNGDLLRSLDFSAWGVLRWWLHEIWVYLGKCSHPTAGCQCQAMYVWLTALRTVPWDGLLLTVSGLPHFK